MAAILQLPKRKVLQPPTATAVPDWATKKIEGEPSMETTVMEAVAIRKWLHFALEDIHFQLEQMARDKAVSRRSFQEAKNTAMAISSYLIGVLGDLDERLAAPLPPSTPAAS